MIGQPKISFVENEFRLTGQSKIFLSKFTLDTIIISLSLNFYNIANNKIISENNIAYGNKVRTGYAWKLDNIKKINYDKEVNGQLGLWNIDLNEKESNYSDYEKK